MKTLVAYYSRTGVTRKAAQAIAEKLEADVEEIIDRKKRAGVLGFLSGGWDAFRRKTLPIEPTQHDPAEYDLVIVGTPVWANTATPAVRSYLKEHAGGIFRAAFFCTLGGRNAGKTFADMQGVCGTSPAATMALRRKNVEADRHADDVKAFVDSLRG